MVEHLSEWTDRSTSRGEYRRIRGLMSAKILIIEDDQDIAGLLIKQTQELGYQAVHRADGESGLSCALNDEHVLILLDLNLPKRDGLDVCRSIRAQNRTVPIIMLTARHEEIDRVLGLEIGADDYIAKPFSAREVVARMRALLRRATVSDSDATPSDENRPILAGQLRIDPIKRRIDKAGTQLELTALEFDLLVYLARHPGRPFTREQLVERIWQYSASGYENTVTTLINRLRNKIEQDSASPRYVLTVRGVGYRFAERSELEDLS